MRVDIIPFGPIESAQRTITWPNDHLMHVFGFREALAAAVRVKLPGGLVVTAASLPAQSLLKLFAWRDRRYQDRRDAIDLKSILLAYHQGGHLDVLYTEHLDTLEKYEFDPALAGAARMGREARFLVAAADHALLHAVLEDDLLRALASDMDGRRSDNVALLKAYRAGFS